jgi:hypothetical protein
MTTERQERQQAAKKAREEIRNAVRAEMVAQGFSREKLERAMTDIATQVAKQLIASRKITDIIEKNITAAIEKAKVDVTAMAPSFKSIGERVERQVGIEIAELAKQRVRECVEINFTKGVKAYPEGGSF